MNECKCVDRAKRKQSIEVIIFEPITVGSFLRRQFLHFALSCFCLICNLSFFVSILVQPFIYFHFLFYYPNHHSSLTLFWSSSLLSFKMFAFDSAYLTPACLLLVGQSLLIKDNCQFINHTQPRHLTSIQHLSQSSCFPTALLILLFVFS